MTSNREELIKFFFLSHGNRLNTRIDSSFCFVEYCDCITDFRQEGKVKHLFKDILFISVAGTTANDDSWTQIEDFAETHEEWLCVYQQ